MNSNKEEFDLFKFLDENNIPHTKIEEFDLFKFLDENNIPHTKIENVDMSFPESEKFCNEIKAAIEASKKYADDIIG